jgi:GNAT superfamily N-acetyltransferase
MTAVREVAGEDWAICRALLPASGRCPAASRDGLLAVQPGEPRVAGAAVIDYDDVFAWINLLVLPRSRRRGTGTLLLEAAIRAAGRRAALRAIAMAGDAAASLFLERRGFTAMSRFITFEADFGQAARLFRDARDRVTAGRCVPSGVRLTTIPEAPPEQVARLYAGHIANRADLSEAPIAWKYDAERWRYSPVVMVDGVVQAVMFLEVNGEMGHIHARIVAPGFRGGWANALQLGMFAELGLSTGMRRFRFQTRDTTADTLRMAKRVGAREIAVATRFERDIGGGAPTAGF